MDELNTSQKKKLVKNKIVEWIVKEAGGQVTVIEPEAGIEGVDLVVKKRGAYPGKEIYLQVAGCEKLADEFIKNISKEEFKSQENIYLIFAYFDLVEQDIADYIWLLPSLEFENLTEPETTEKGGSILRFKVPINPRKKNKYTPFLINKKDLTQFLLRIIASEKFEWPEFISERIQVINLKELEKFIIEARKNTFAGDGIPVSNPRLIGSKQLEYQKGDYFYRDIYFTGEKNFIGQEIVYQSGKSLWSMVYFGLTTPEEVEKFLKKALLKLANNCRFGGGFEFEEDDFRYQDKGEGKLERFSGKEEIFMKNKKVYELNYLGGLISK